MYKQITLQLLAQLIKEHPAKYVFAEITTEKHAVELVFPVEKYTALAIINAAINRLPENKDELVAFAIKDNNIYFGAF